MLNQRLSHKTSQALVMSKNMQQSLKILQMTTQELVDFVSQESVDNPFLEIEQADLSSISNESGGSDEIDTSNYWQDDQYLRYESVSNSNYNSSDVNEDNIASRVVSLKAHLMEQINMECFNNKERFIAMYITDLLDDNGYLHDDIPNIAKALQCTDDEASYVLDKLQGLDPVGVYARDIKECIRLQVLDKELDDPDMMKLIDNLECIGARDMGKASRMLNIKPEMLQQYIATIRSLDPKPGSTFASEDVRSKVPDAIIYKDNNGMFRARLNTANMPQIFVNSKYYDQVYNRTKTEEERKYCSTKLQNANWIMRSVAQRSETIIKIATRIAEEQFEFLSAGLDYLKPMTLSDMAKLVGLHESTISRVSNKFIATPFGVFEMKYFFSNSLSSNISENMVSTRAVKSRLQALVDTEKNTKKVLSDDDLAKALSEQGINISRRTVAKYRESLKIAPSHLRKRRVA